LHAIGCSEKDSKKSNELARTQTSNEEHIISTIHSNTVASIGLFLAYLAENLGVLFVPECRPLPHLFQFDQFENSHEVNCKPYAVLE
jgi:hypothetical protein